MVRSTVAIAFLAVVACRSSTEKAEKKRDIPVEAPRQPELEVVDPYVETRTVMVERTIANRGIKDERVLTAMRITPRHEFVPPAIRHKAYDDNALPIGFGLTISQPYIIAAMTEAAKVKAGDKVLEIGTGSGYQAAVLAVMGAKVYTIEIHEELGKRTQQVFQKAAFNAIKMKIGDGFFGWPDAGPFDAIMVTCAAEMVPAPLLAQLKPGGLIVAVLGDDYEQSIQVVNKSGERQLVMDQVRFGPMLGKVREGLDP